MRKKSDKYSTLCICLLLALTTLAVYWQLHAHEFVHYDDDEYVTENPNVKAGLTRQSIVWAFTTTHGSNWHPLTWFSHMLDCHLFGLNPRWHHMTNLFIHILNTLLLFWVLKKMTRGIWQSAFVAAVFALHPLHVESVAWVAERKDVLSTLFGLITIAAYLKYLERPGTIRYVLMSAAFALGLLAKPMLVTLPIILLLLDYWPLGRLKNKKTFYRLVREKIPLFIITGFSIIATIVGEQETKAAFGLLPFNVRITNAFISYVLYVLKMFWPARLAVFYPHPEATLPVWQIAASALLFMVAFIWVVRLAVKRPYLIVGWFWYVITLVPVIGLVQVGAQARADRYTYIPSIGIFIILAWAATELLGKWRYRKIVLALCSLTVIFALSVCTWIQLRYWKNSMSLFERALSVTTNNCKMHCNLGLELQMHGKIDQAVPHFREAVRIKPDYVNALNNLGRALQLQGKRNEAITCFQRALKFNPNHPGALTNLGNLLQSMGKQQEAAELFQRALAAGRNNPDVHHSMGLLLQSQRKLDQAIVHFRKALQIDPYYAEIHNNLGITFAMQKKYAEAASCFRNAIGLKPNYAEAHYNLANALKLMGRLDEAVAHFQLALKNRPAFAEAHYNLARTLELQNKPDEAMMHYRWALSARPDWPGPMNGLASILATHPDVNARDPNEAIELANRAAKLTKYQNAVILDTLAAGHAAAGHHKEAVVFARLAYKKANENKNQQLADEIKQKIQLYEKSKPPPQDGVPEMSNQK